MLIIAIGWVFVVVVFALGQASSTGGTLLGALLTLVLGLAPLAVVIYISLAVSRRRRARRRQRRIQTGGHAAGDPSRRNEKNRESSCTVHQVPPLTR
jgi:hypothetical protein